jgi:hypothetical protein
MQAEHCQIARVESHRGAVPCRAISASLSLLFLSRDEGELTLALVVTVPSSDKKESCYIGSGRRGDDSILRLGTRYSVTSRMMPHAPFFQILGSIL